MKFQRQRREEVNVNLTPLIDVVFLLLIFFMVSTTFTKETHLEVDLPEAAEATQLEEQPQTVDIIISAEGTFSVNGQPLINTQAETLRIAILKVLGDQASLEQKPPLIVTADAKTPHQFVVTAMDVAGQLGFDKLSITTQQAAE
ncbi:biopolymer transporter ExbD [Neptunomonas phycophila]|uniref:ExbD/TolR family protein n=1 Tax=Neptunomonas TaxID=75687 RepID=UPI000948A08E|nr:MULTISPECIES: biopolymer transporter ExbD [Neptunomonas]MBT3147380.1 biopolymer transporter ExbD [Neptunomonas phycophila]MDN2660446.1 biopolymer transporter ExbD [Neptunomonas sp. CHC150]MDO6469543.1 biopolymer transporter ExbD [Neptunomonas phycophila]MDO6785207.1 biopolymer transporter ExbD [Neptunomonas phycophila]QLE97513.1 biopolymer transporter ExbD [Neptunomonas phycophila]